MATYREVLDAVQGMGLELDELLLDGEFHRVRVSQKRRYNKDGAYCLKRLDLGDGGEAIIGVAQNWYTDHQETFTVQTGAVAQLSPEQRRDVERRHQELREQEHRVRRDKQEATAERAEGIWKGLPDTGRAPYLDRKRVKAWGVRFSRGSVVVPLRDGDGKLWSLQFIKPQKDETGRDKTFLSGGRKKGCFHFITGTAAPFPDSPPKVIGIAEGYSTGASVFEGLGPISRETIPVALAFDAGNLMAVATALRKLYPAARFVFFGDDDRSSRNGLNAGRDKADTAAKAFGGVAVYPNFDGVDASDRLTDWNDLLVEAGPEEFWRQLQQALSVAKRSFTGGTEPPEIPPAEVYEDDAGPWPKHRGAWEWLGKLTRNDKGVINASMSNVELILSHDPEWDGVIGYCEFSHKIVMCRQPPMPGSKVGEWEDGDTARTHIWLHRYYGIRVSERDLEGAVLVIAESNRIHPVQEHFRRLRGRWDGESRLDIWLKRTFAPEENDKYIAAAGRMWPISAVARIMNPGCKADTVLILEGKQGNKKSTAFAVLAGEWFSDATINLGEKDSYQLIQGVWIYELAELDALNKSEITTAKAFFSQQHDRFRPPFGKNTKEFKRQVVVVGTTNADEYLRDFTGNRRYWPLKCTKRTDVDWLRQNKEQIWAEALYRYEAGEKWWLDDETDGELIKLFEDEQDKRVQRDPWEAAIVRYTDGLTKDWVTADELLTKAIRFDMRGIQQAHQQRVSRIMQGLGYRKGRRYVTDEDSRKRYRQVYVIDKQPGGSHGPDPFE